MPNLRIVSDNAIARAAALVASTTAGGLAAANLAIDKKSSVHRATDTSVTYTASWPTAEPLGCVALPFCNLSPTAQMRVRTSNEGSKTNYAKYSENPSNAAWAKWNCTIGTTEADAAGVKAPSGAGGVEKLKEQTGGEKYISQVWPVPAGQKVTVSFFVRAAERTLAAIKFDNTANTAAPFGSRAFFDMATGTVTMDVDGGWSHSMASLPGGWWRISATRITTAAGNIVPRLVIGSLNASGEKVLLYTGVTGYGIYVWGAQFEYDALSSYYPNNSGGTSTRPIGYRDNWQTPAGSYDSGWVPACPAPATRLRGFTAAQAASAYAYGGGACARHWFSQVEASLLIVDLADPNNLQGYIEAACLVAGPVWSPRYNASATSVSLLDRTELSRSAAGDQLADAGTISRKVPVDLRAMPEADRAKFLALVRNSRAYPILLSVFPEHPDLELERDFIVYGRRTKDSDIAYQFAGAYSTTLEIEEI